MTEEELARYHQTKIGGGIPNREFGLSKFSNPNGEIMPSAYTRGSDNAAALSGMFPGFNSTMFPGGNMNRRSEVAPPPGLFSTQMNQEDDYGGVFGKIGEYGGKALDWAGQQGVSELFKMGMGIKDQFFDRPKMIQSYLDQAGSMNALRGKQMAALDQNIAGQQRNEARTTAMQLRNYNAQRPQGTPEKTQLTPNTYV